MLFKLLKFTATAAIVVATATPTSFAATSTAGKIIEIKKTKPTLHVREDLGYWKCSQTLQDGSTCGCYNVMEFKQCKDCKSRRGVGDDGTDAYGTKIAKIVHVNNENGNEFWQYLIEE